MKEEEAFGEFSRLSTSAWLFALTGVSIIGLGLAALAAPGGQVARFSWIGALGPTGTVFLGGALLALGVILAVVERRSGFAVHQWITAIAWGIMGGLVTFALLVPASCTILFVDGVSSSRAMTRCDNLLGMSFSRRGSFVPATDLPLLSILAPILVAMTVSLLVAGVRRRMRKG